MTKQEKETLMTKLHGEILNTENRLLDLQTQLSKLSWLPDAPDEPPAPVTDEQASAEAPPRCDCGNTNNLTEVIATPEGTYHLCPEHLAEERER